MSNGPVFEQETENSSWFKRSFARFILPLAVIAVLTLIIINLARPAEGDLSSVAALVGNTTPASGNPSTTPPQGTQEITVLAGDNYTLVARRAVTNTLAIEERGTITKGARLYAETKLVADLKKQPLVVGGHISYVIPNVLDYLYGFNALPAGQKTKWQSMASRVKF